MELGSISGKIVDNNLEGTLNNDYTLVFDYILNNNLTVENGKTLYKS